MEGASPLTSYWPLSCNITSGAFYWSKQVTTLDAKDEEMTPSLGGRSDRFIMQRGMDTGRHDLFGVVIKTIYTLLPPCMKLGEDVCLLWHSHSRKCQLSVSSQKGWTQPWAVADLQGVLSLFLLLSNAALD